MTRFIQSSFIRFFPIATAVLIASGSIGSTAHALEQPQAQDVCSKVNINGKYALRDQDPTQHWLVFKQQGCALSVYDTFSKASWRFDLSGKTATVVPAAILKHNSKTEFALRSMKSLRVQTRLIDETQIEVKAWMNLPKVDAANPAASNDYDVDLAFSGILRLSGYGTVDMDKMDVSYIYLRDVKIQVARVQGDLLFGPLAEGFKMGANYILGKVSGSLSSLFWFANVQKSN